MIRRPVRKSITTGTSVYGVVESYSLGLATVVLEGGGTRLTNLSTIGGEVTPGQIVIVDYSAGVNPIVRPLFVDEESTSLEIAIADPHDEGDVAEDQDYGCCAWHQGSYSEGLHILGGQPFILPFGWNNPVLNEHAGSWDTGSWIDFGSNPGREYLLVPYSGKYIIDVSWNEFWSNIAGTTFIGHGRVRVLVNGGQRVLGQFHVRNAEGYGFQGGLTFTMIDELYEGDQVSLELFQNIGSDYWIDNYGYYFYDTRSIKIQYLPGTSARFYGNSSTVAYTEGA